MAEIVYIPIQLLAVLEALVAEAVIQATTLVELQDSLEEQGMIGTELQQELTEQNAAQQAVEAERQQYWPKLVAMYRDYADYQARTERTIPVVVLSPA